MKDGMAFPPPVTPSTPTGRRGPSSGASRKTMTWVRRSELICDRPSHDAARSWQALILQAGAEHVIPGQGVEVALETQNLQHAREDR